MKRFALRNFLISGVFALLCVVLFPRVSYGCGTQRWGVKVVQDNHAKYFYKNKNIAGGELVDPVNTTVSWLSNQAWPFEWSKGTFPQQWSYMWRAGVAEFTIWRVKAILLKKKDEDDKDYHLVIRAGQKKMIAEIPSEECLADSPEPIKSMIIQARSDFDAWYAEQPDKDNLNKQVTLVGIGYFDRVHGNAEGQVQKNGIELHPVIKIDFHW